MEGVTPCIEWANDNETLFYVELDHETLRWNRIRRHRLGSDVSGDPIVFEETDPNVLHVHLPLALRPLPLHRVLADTEHRGPYLGRGPAAVRADPLPSPANAITSTPSIILPTRFSFVRTGTPRTSGSCRRTTPAAARTAGAISTVPTKRSMSRASSRSKITSSYSKRDRGLSRIRIRSRADGSEHCVDFGEPSYSVGLSHNHESDTSVVRYEVLFVRDPLFRVRLRHEHTREDTAQAGEGGSGF